MINIIIIIIIVKITIFHMKTLKSSSTRRIQFVLCQSIHPLAMQITYNIIRRTRRHLQHLSVTCHTLPIRTARIRASLVNTHEPDRLTSHSWQMRHNRLTLRLLIILLRSWCFLFCLIVMAYMYSINLLRVMIKLHKIR